MNGAAGFCYLKGLHYVIAHFQLWQKQTVLFPHSISSNIYLYRITGTCKESGIFPALKIKTNVLFLNNSATTKKIPLLPAMLIGSYFFKNDDEAEDDNDGGNKNNDNKW